MTMPLGQELGSMAKEEIGWWSGQVDVSRTPSPRIPAKRMRMTVDELGFDFNQESFYGDDELNLSRAQRTPESLGYGNHENFEQLWVLPNDSPPTFQQPAGRRKMQTGCIPCLYVFVVRFVADSSTSTDQQQSQRHTMRPREPGLQAGYVG